MGATQVDDNGRTALSVAAAEGQLEVVNLLLEAGADPNVKDRRGNTPLYDAVLYKHFEVLSVVAFTSEPSKRIFFSAQCLMVRKRILWAL
jgi:hypothetical protein